eukprot:1161587-Pelagomonas_calceolata.AAC.22
MRAVILLATPERVQQSLTTTFTAIVDAAPASSMRAEEVSAWWSSLCTSQKALCFFHTATYTLLLALHAQQCVRVGRRSNGDASNDPSCNSMHSFCLVTPTSPNPRQLD